jgi:hypothetical protein
LTLTDLQPRTRARNASRYRPIAVVDIGSNSVRLVIYEGPWRHAAALHNEKAICAIGRNMVSSGRLDEGGMAFALDTLARFRELCEGHQVADVGAVATSAARDASNGRDFIRRAEKALGQPIRILSGEEEARIAAEGTLAGIPNADGLVADLGGGSLDMVTVKDGKTGDAATLPFGPLRLMDVADGKLDKARFVCGGRHLAGARPCRYGRAGLPSARAAPLCDARGTGGEALPSRGRSFAQILGEDAFRAQASRRSAALWGRRHGGDDLEPRA